MKALSLTQPWASLITDFGMNVENRTWNTKFRGFFAIHATKTISDEQFIYVRKAFKIKLRPEDLPYGSIIGITELTDVITSDMVTKDTRKWFIGDYGFVMRNIIKLPRPVPAKGSLNFWNMEDEILDQCLVQLRPDQLRLIQKDPG